MRQRTRGEPPLSAQVAQRVQSGVEQKEEYEGDFSQVISTGSTLVDLAISAGRIRGGGIPGGIMVEVYGPESSGKTVLLCEAAGDVQRKGGENQFKDPEGRLDHQYALLFGAKFDEEHYSRPDTVPEVFRPIRVWEPKNPNVINGIMTDSLAALSTNLEMDNDEGDKMGMRRAKEFSEELRKTCRIVKQKNYLLMCSNQIRESGETFGPKYKAPGGKAIAFYSSLRLKTEILSKIKKTKTINGKEVSRIVGVNIEVEVVKSSIWKPYRTAPVTILFDYGIDDLKQNLQFVKDFTKNTVYTVGGVKVGQAMDDAIRHVEADPALIHTLKNEVIDLWMEIESKFDSDRKPKHPFEPHGFIHKDGVSPNPNFKI